MLRFLTQNEAIALDAELMNDTYAYTSIQLMELAGLACADAIRDAYPHASRLLVLVGPGNNGGDAMVAARHLHQYGVGVTLHFPRDTPASDEHLKRLRLQCDAMGIARLALLPPPEQWATQFDVIVDGLFGFSFKSAGGVHPPFDATIAAVNAAAVGVPVVSLDIPSGWDVDSGNVSGLGIRCDVLISLTAPKKCAQHLGTNAKHYIGGRFVPPAMAHQHALGLPTFPGTQQFVLLLNN